MITEVVALTPDATAWFTGRDVGRGDPPVGAAGNLSHRRPHLPTELARDREALARVTGYPPDRWHLMRQVHGAEVAVVDRTTPIGAELADVDAVVTEEPGRPLAVQTADCVPLLLAGAAVVAAAHAGRRGVELDVVGATLRLVARLGHDPGELVAAIGPAIGGCCYELPDELRRPLLRAHPVAEASTSWGSPSLDLPAAVEARLRAAGIVEVRRVGGCTRCDPRWFSHRADPRTGRQLAMVARAPREDVSRTATEPGWRAPVRTSQEGQLR